MDELCEAPVPLHPTQGSGDYPGRPGLCALAMSDQQSLGVPAEHFFTCRPGFAAPEKTGSPLSRSAAVFADQAVEPHQHAFPARHRRFRVTLDEVADDRGTRSAVKEHHFFHEQRATKDNLIDIGRPCRVGLVAKFCVKPQFWLPLRKARWRIHARFRPTPGPLSQEQMVNLVW